MTEDVLIKEVEGQKIWLKEEMLEKHASMIFTGFFIICCIISAAWACWVGQMVVSCQVRLPPVPLDVLQRGDVVFPICQNDNVFPIVLLFGILSAVGIICMLLIKNSYCSAYVVHTTGADGIVIFKTTPEADQVLICRAAQELEVKIKEMIKEKRMLETIAGRCK